MKEGRKAPSFKLRDQDGNTVSLADLAGRTVVLYFFPKANTPGCTAQACGIRDRMDDYDAADAIVVGVSRDDPGTLREFADEHDLPFTLLSDPDHKVAEKYGVWVEKSMYGRSYMGVQRATFVIGPDGKLLKAFPKVTPKTHDQRVLGALGS
ncbi:MAG TPA: thioredoxin-dependent thiol peroxidase [Solirubrobacterales bacterium]|nr:thioredoxin-dependent thiol peroxidase [Solirubrobacterales bacterium]